MLLSFLFISRGYEQENGANQVKATQRVKAEFLIQKAGVYDMQLSSLISCRIRSDTVQHIMSLRLILLSHLHF